MDEVKSGDSFERAFCLTNRIIKMHAYNEVIDQLYLDRDLPRSEQKYPELHFLLDLEHSEAKGLVDDMLTDFYTVKPNVDAPTTAAKCLWAYRISGN